MGFLKRLFGKKSNSSNNNESTEEALKLYNESLDIVGEYGSILEHRKIYGISDVKYLPYTKDEIKKALIIIYMTTKDSTIREQIKISYMSLAQWQDGVGDKDIGLDLSDLENTSQTGDSKQQAENIASKMDKFSDWVKILDADRAKLKTELDNLEKSMRVSPLS